METHFSLLGFLSQKKSFKKLLLANLFKAPHLVWPQKLSKTAKTKRAQNETRPGKISNEKIKMRLNNFLVVEEKKFF